VGGAAARSAIGPNIADASQRVLDSTRSTWSKKDCPDSGLTRKDQKVNHSSTFRTFSTLSLFVNMMLTSYTAIFAFAMTAQAGGKETEMIDKAKSENIEIATFAGGCFWCMQPPFDKIPGVEKTLVGYTGGKIEDPTYEQVSAGATNHTEAIQIYFDRTKVSYAQLVDEFWRNIDPTQADGQFADRGTQYRTAIFVHSPEQRKIAEASKAKLHASSKFGRPIVTTIEPAADFYRAEEAHQSYYKKNAKHYNLYKVGSGRAGFIEENWGREGDVKGKD